MPDKPLEKKGVHTMEVAVWACTIHSVVVYRDRAEVKRIVPTSLAAGENKVVLTGLAECVDKNSIRYAVGREYPSSSVSPWPYVEVGLTVLLPCAAMCEWG